MSQERMAMRSYGTLQQIQQEKERLIRILRCIDRGRWQRLDDSDNHSGECLEKSTKDYRGMPGKSTGLAESRGTH